MYQWERELILDENCRNIVMFMLDNRCTIRQAEDNLGISRSTIHRYIHKEIKYRYPESYDEIVDLLKYNKTYRAKCRSSWR